MSTAAPLPAPERIDSVDLLRGLIMVIMALDHTRDYFHNLSLQGVDPLDLTRTTPALYFTRWITHFCAPLFSFLAGTGVFLSAARGKPKRELSWFLVTRGLWLIFLELTLVRFFWLFSFDLHTNWGLVLWALGWSMIVLAGLVHLPVWAAGVFGVALIAGHNAFDGVNPSNLGAWEEIWRVLHVPGPVPIGANFTFLPYYALVPWVGVMAAGFALGAVFRLPGEQRQRWLVGIGATLTLAFLALRASNVYGDPAPWATQATPLQTAYSFLNCAKYPPSLCYLLMTLGPGLLVLAWFERRSPSLFKPFIVFGRVPFFYYLLHIPLIHGAAYAINWLRFGPGNFLAFGDGETPPAGIGVNLFVTYLVWIAVVALLYPACRRFAGLIPFLFQRYNNHASLAVPRRHFLCDQPKSFRPERPRGCSIC